MRLEELESRLAPASYAVNAQLDITHLDNLGDTAAGTHAVVFFESTVTEYQVLRQGLGAGTDAVLLDSDGDGLREMAAFLAGRHGLTSIGVVAHGSTGFVALGTAMLDEQSLGSYSRELAVVGSALALGGELDLWSCDVAAGQAGESLVRDLAAATGAGVAASDHAVGSEAQGGTWQLNVRSAGASGQLPFGEGAVGAFHETLGIWYTPSFMAITRTHHTATMLANGKVLVTGGEGTSGPLGSAELYDPTSNTWSSAGSMTTARMDQTATLLSNGKVLVTGGANSIGTLSSAELYDPVTNTWSSAGSLAKNRQNQTATLLGNGKVLVAGGFNSIGTLSSAELYDPVTNTWSSAGSMSTQRAYQTATLLGNGEVLVTGGSNVSALSSADLYDPASNTWSSAGSMAIPRKSQTATLLGNGKVLVTGGTDNNGNALASAELYDPVANTWSTAGSLSTARASATATILGSGEVLVTGGTDNNGNALASAELYDPVANSWSSAGFMGVVRSSQTAILLGNGNVLVAGGTSLSSAIPASAELFEPNLPTPPAAWSSAGSMATARFDQTATLLNNGKVLITGGGGNGGSFSSAELYDPASNTWSSAGSMATARVHQTATLLPSGKVLVAGGQNTNTNVFLSNAELYDPISNAWSSAGSMATARAWATATLLVNGKVLVAGGQNGSILSTAEVYDPVSNSWYTTDASVMATARFLQTATLLGNGKVLVTGGQGNSGILASAELYDPVANSWSSAGSMAAARLYQTATLLSNGKVLVTGGQSGITALPLASAELYDPISNTWSAAGTLLTPRFLHTATLLSNGTVLVTGGEGNGYLNRADLYDPLSNSWSSTAFLATAREQHTSTLLGNGKVLVVGGTGPSIGNLSSAELYDLDRATQLVISRLSPTNVTAGGTITFTMTAEDSNNNPLPGYTGTVTLTSTDKNALYNGGSMPTNYTFVASDNGSHTFTVTLQTDGSRTVTLTDLANSSLTATTSAITVSGAEAFSKFAFSVQGGNTVVAGTLFLLTPQATDAFGNPVSGSTVPSNITATASPNDPRGNFPLTAPVNSSGFAFLVGTLQTPSSYTITAGGASTNVTVTPAAANYFTVTAPASATTGTAFNVTVKAFDAFGNPASGYTGTVNLTSTDQAAYNLLSNPYTFVAGDNGVHSFSVTLNSSTLGRAGTTIIVRDTTATAPPISGFSAPVTVRSLELQANAANDGFRKTATGFTVTFSKPFTPADLTMYGSNTTTVQDVTLVGADIGNGPFNVPGTLYLDPTTPNTIVFKASSAYLLATNQGIGGTGDNSVALPDDTYVATIVSGVGTNGFVDALGSHLDGLGNGGTANFTQTFSTNFQDDAHANANPAQVLAIPDFARGPDGSTTITVPNNKAAPGIPITLYNAAGVQDATFTLAYNPTIFTPTGGGTGDSSVGSTFTMGAITSIDSTHSSAGFTYHNATAHSRTVVLGDILAKVPNSAATIYKTKELLTLSGITVTGGATVQAANGIHVDAYLGDVHVTALPAIDASDALDAQKVASGAVSGFSAYTLLDPAIIGNVGQNMSVDAAAVTNLFSKTAHLAVPRIPTIPAAVTSVSVSGADPMLSLVGAAQANGIVSVAVMLDHPHPAGSTGMTEAHLALTYDPSVLSVSASDITLGSIPGLGAGWQITSAVDAATGQIGITLFNLSGTPITDTQAGSLVDIAFHVMPGAVVPAAEVQLVTQVTLNGQRFDTDVDDDQGPLTLSLGVDRLVILTGLGGRIGKQIK